MERVQFRKGNFCLRMGSSNMPLRWYGLVHSGKETTLNHSPLNKAYASLRPTVVGHVPRGVVSVFTSLLSISAILTLDAFGN